MREGGGDGSRQVEGGKAGRQAGKMLSWYPVLGIVQSALYFNPCRNVRSKPISTSLGSNYSGILIVWTVHVVLSSIHNHSV